MKINCLLGFIIISILLLSLALNYVFYKKSFIPLHALALDPIGLNYYSATAIHSKPNNEKAIFMYYGDSRGLSWPFIEDDRYTFINRSIGNQTSVQINDRFEAHVTPHKPDIILIQMCVNDLKMIPLFPEQRESILKACKANINDLLNKARGIKAKVILSTVFPLADVSLARKILGIREQPIIDAINDINKYIMSQEASDTVIFDSYSLLRGSNKKVDSRYSRDWLHLNERGYQLLNQSLAQLIERMSL
ncbi:MAG: Lysophospholipase [uncultured Thiotrichaceae bacterium]|uniref:Lysophospholipase n=1 Tax=uncultured Thiotrichaceae bacterium TaxID=298394 RepID=A0A6S6TJ73_9GAMM|nr:MAG: Lysophospholipase [uncultured Thiotrichaceae bacterium]